MQSSVAVNLPCPELHAIVLRWSKLLHLFMSQNSSARVQVNLYGALRTLTLHPRLQPRRDLGNCGLADIPPPPAMLEATQTSVGGPVGGK